MFNKGKVFTIGLGISALAAALFSFTDGDDDDKKKKYHIIHQQGGELTEYDTIIPMSSSYTVENFLADKGIDDDGVEIVKIPSHGNHFMFKGEEHGELRHDGNHVMIREFKHDVEIDGDGESKEVKITCEMGEDGKMVTKKFVNGEEVELTEEDKENIEKHKGMKDEFMIMKLDMDDIEGHEMEFITEGGEGEMIEITVEIDDEGNKVIKKKVNGEDVEMTEEELKKIEMHEHKRGEHMFIEMDVEGDHPQNGDNIIMEFNSEDAEIIEIQVEIDDEGNRVIKKTVNGEEVEVSEEEMENIKMHKGHKGHGEHRMMIHHMDDSDMTEEEKEAMMKKLKDELHHMTFELDSMNVEIELETLMEEFHQLEGEQEEMRVIVKTMEMDGDDLQWKHTDENHRMRMMHSGDEDFTIVLVTEGLTNEEVENVEVKREMNSDNMMIFPNPNNGEFTIEFDQSEKVRTTIEILNAEGKVVFEDKLGRFSGKYTKKIDLKDSGSGLYIINIQQGDKIVSNKIIVE